MVFVAMIEIEAVFGRRTPYLVKISRVSSHLTDILLGNPADLVVLPWPRRLAHEPMPE